MSSARPAVSVLMPMRNAAPYVKAALKSILRETSVPLEVIVVDDGSTDRSARVVQKLRDPSVKLIPGPEQGIAAAFNVAIEAASGELVMRCDADDLFARGRIRRQADWLAAHPDFGAICGGFSAKRGWTTVPFVNVGDDEEEVTAELRRGVTRSSFCTWAVRTGVVRSIGGARDFFRTAEDIDLQLRIGEQCRVWFDPANAYHWRLHDASITHGGSTVQSRAYFDLKALEFQKQRLQRGADDLQDGNVPAGGPKHGPMTVNKNAGSRHMRDLLIAASWNAYAKGKKSVAVGRALEAIGQVPASRQPWRCLIILLAKLGLGRSR